MKLKIKKQTKSILQLPLLISNRNSTQKIGNAKIDETTNGIKIDKTIIN